MGGRYTNAICLWCSVWDDCQPILTLRGHCSSRIVRTSPHRWEDDTLVRVIIRGRLRTSTHTELARFLDCSSNIGYRW